MPPYYLPTPSVKNRNNYFPQSEPLGPDEMRIIFMGSNPWPPRMTQASTCIMVEAADRISAIRVDMTTVRVACRGTAR